MSNLDWKRPDSNNVESIPILDEFYFINSKGSIFQDNYTSSHEKIINKRISDRKNPKYILIDNEKTTHNKDQKNNSWLTTISNHADKRDKRLCDTFRTTISSAVDISNSVLKEENHSKNFPSVLNTCCALIKNLYDKLNHNSGSICKINNIFYTYESKKYKLYLVKEISNEYSEYLAIDMNNIESDTILIILNNDLQKLIFESQHPKGPIEGLLGRAYSNRDQLVFQDIVDNETIYFLNQINYDFNFIDIDLKPKPVKNSKLFIHDVLESMTTTNSNIYVDMTYCIDDYYRVKPSIDSIRAFIIEGHSIIGGFDCVEDIYKSPCKESGMISSPVINNTSKKIIGGLCVLFVGFDDKKRLLKFKNPYGNDWGDKGYGYLPYDYLLMGFASDFWVVFGFAKKHNMQS